MQYRREQRGDYSEYPITQRQAQNMQEQETLNGEDSVGRGGQYGFKARVFPLIGFIVAMVSIGGAYYVARSKTPPDVPPFPQTDITHTGLKFPEYTFLRIGLMVAAPIIAICFQSLKNFLNIKSFELTGEPAKGLKHFGFLSILSCLAFSLSTASMSDGGDMNWTLHVIGASSFFVISLLLMLKASKVYRKLWKIKPGFIGFWSYQIKKYTNFCIVAFIAMQLLEILKVIQIYSLVEWLATLFLLVYVFTLYWDFDKMSIWLVKKRGQ